MKKRIVFLFGLLLVLICLSTAVAEDAVTPADQPFQNEAIEQAHLIAQAKLKKDYVYDPRLFTCILKAETDEAFEFTFNWVYSTVAIYTVSVPADLDENHIVTSLTTVFLTIAKRFRDEGMFRFLDEENLALIKRKVPEIRLKDLVDALKNVFHTLFSYFSIDNEEDIKAFEDGYLAVLHLYLLPDIENSDETIRFLIRGLVLQMVE